MPDLRDELKSLLQTDQLTTIGEGSGCISNGTAYRTAEGREVFVKVNNKADAHRMFVGEEASLKAICETKTVIAPQPIKVIENMTGGGGALVMSYLNFTMRSDDTALGEALARLHMDNWKLLDDNESVSSDGRVGVSKYGFDVPTCCGYLPQKNEWCEDWVEFYCRKIDHQFEMLDKPDKKANDLWSSLKPKVPKLFEGLTIRPSLLHGDLWSGNAGNTSQGVVIFDPASFYGHHEYDLGIAVMFGGFSRSFYDAYHKLIPKQPGHELRNLLYQLFHYMNHWTHFGSSYRGGTVGIMERLLQKV